MKLRKFTALVQHRNEHGVFAPGPEFVFEANEDFVNDSDPKLLRKSIQSMVDAATKDLPGTYTFLECGLAPLPPIDLCKDIEEVYNSFAALEQNGPTVCGEVTFPTGATQSDIALRIGLRRFQL